MFFPLPQPALLNFLVISSLLQVPSNPKPTDEEHLPNPPHRLAPVPLRIHDLTITTWYINIVEFMLDTRGVRRGRVRY
jgi:hypothetical protein